MSKLQGYNADGTKINFKDLPVRLAVIHFAKEALGYNVISNSNDDYKIDLISENGDCPDIECERSNCTTEDYWTNKNYSQFLHNATPSIKFKTLNFQGRKEHYWQEGDHYYTRGKHAGKFWYTEHNHLTNLFVRTTFNFTQFMVIRPEVIRDESKVLRAWKQPTTIHKNEPEPWLGFRYQDVETWNFKNGIYSLDKRYESQQSIH